MRNRFSYYFVIIVLLFASLIIYNKKTNFIDNLFAKKPDEIAELRQKIEFLNIKLETEKNKIYILGLINNENTKIIERNYIKADLIYVTPDWKLSKMPKYLNLTVEEKEAIEKHVQ